MNERAYSNTVAGETGCLLMVSNYSDSSAGWVKLFYLVKMEKEVECGGAAKSNAPHGQSRADSVLSQKMKAPDSSPALSPLARRAIIGERSSHDRRLRGRRLSERTWGLVDGSSMAVVSSLPDRPDGRHSSPRAGRSPRDDGSPCQKV
jgi:hypothetical protein